MVIVASTIKYHVMVYGDALCGRLAGITNQTIREPLGAFVLVRLSAGLQ